MVTGNAGDLAEVSINAIRSFFSVVGIRNPFPSTKVFQFNSRVMKYPFGTVWSTRQNSFKCKNFNVKFGLETKLIKSTIELHKSDNCHDGRIWNYVWFLDSTWSKALWNSNCGEKNPKKYWNRF